MSKSKLLIAFIGPLIFLMLHNCTTESNNSKIDKEKIIDKTVARKDIYKKSLFPKWISERKHEQVQKSKAYKVFNGFSFKDEIMSSNINFKHEINPDCAKYYKASHYDHGNGVAVADVDNDGLYDLYFVSQVKSGELWKNLGSGKFKNITAESGLSNLNKNTYVSASFGDIDNDGDPDLYITAIKDGNILLENDGQGKFTNISQDSGTAHKAHSSGSIFFDYNKDGLLDLFVTNVGKYTTDQLASFDIGEKSYKYYVAKEDAFYRHVKPEEGEQSVLYKNLGNNKFEDVTNQVGLQNASWSGDAIFVDFNEDGFDDIYLPNMQGDDLYFENQKGQKFIEKSKEFFPHTSWGAMSLKAFDFDNNGTQDIYITDMHSDMIAAESSGYEEEKIKKKSPMPESFLMTKGQSIFGNSFFKKSAPNKYEEVSSKINLENYWPWGFSVGDLNADGFEDLFITRSMNYPYRYQTNSLMLNNKGKDFLESEFILGVEPRRDGRYTQAWYELDCDGKDKGHKECKDRSGDLTIWGSLGSRCSAIFDIDNDGDLDIVTNEFNDVPMLLISDLSSQKQDFSFLKIKLEGTKSNRSGIGAKVIVKTNTSTYTKIMDGKLGYLSQSDCPLYFGLPKESKPSSIEVIWPSGKKQVVNKDIRVDSQIVINEN